ncbi:MAG: DNA internalization-related competence protein ComEC/Rec2 [Candidatus Margulisbacteria bacterium]|jgi:competence protein ComEC|nr:DNA internalization-related competence protein ComEC/Rec2 [Candidatus Margulisiibacteriota bacterium]
MRIILAALFYFAGIFLAACFNIYAALFLAGLVFCCWWKKYWRWFFLLCLALGLARTAGHQAALAARLAAAENWRPEQLKLRIVSDLQYKGDAVVFTARADGYKIMARLRGAENLRYGDELTLHKFRLFPLQLKRNFFITGYDDYLYTHGYALRLQADARDITARQTRWSLFGLAIDCKNKFVQIQKQTLPEEQAAIMCTFLFGAASSAIDSETTAEYRRAGVIHLLVVSGMHITLFVALLQSLSGCLRLRPWPSFWLITLVNILFIFAVGAGPSVGRAGLMAEIALLGRTVRRPTDAYNTLTLSGLGLCLGDPLLIFDVGFQLSFAATFSLLFLAPVLTERLNFLPRFLRDLTAVSTAPLLLTTPLCIYYFGGVSLGALFLNMLVLPWVETLTYLGFISSFVGLLSLPLATLLNTVSYGLFVLLDWLVSIFAHTYIDLPQTPLALLFLASGWSFVLALRPRWLSKYTLILSIFILGWRCCPGPGNLRVIFLDVGQGDCIVLTRRRQALVIDCGSESGSAAGDVLKQTLLKLGVDRPDVLLTHAHADHYNGLLELPRIKTLILPDSAPDWLREKLADKAEYLNGELPFVEIHRAAQIDEKNENNNSILAVLTQGDFRALFTGDAEAVAEENFLDIVPEADLFKAGHHGSKTSSSAEFLAAVKPDNAVISCGAHNKYRHPNKEALDRLSVWGNIWRTDTDGAVMVTVYPRNYRLETSATQRRADFSIRAKYF